MHKYTKHADESSTLFWQNLAEKRRKGEEEYTNMLKEFQQQAQGLHVYCIVNWDTDHEYRNPEEESDSPAWYWMVWAVRLADWEVWLAGHGKYQPLSDPDEPDELPDFLVENFSIVRVSRLPMDKPIRRSMGEGSFVPGWGAVTAHDNLSRSDVIKACAVAEVTCLKLCDQNCLTWKATEQRLRQPPRVEGNDYIEITYDKDVIQDAFQGTEIPAMRAWLNRYLAGEPQPPVDLSSELDMHVAEVLSGSNAEMAWNSIIG